MRLLLTIALIATGCTTTRHTHPDWAAQEQAQDDAEVCNYVMKTAPRSCDLDHSHERTKGAIKNWYSGEVLTSSDLNANFTHIHTNMVGGHGGKLMDADVNGSANISTSKLAAYRLIPVAWLIGACSSGVCSITADVGVNTLARTGAGRYTVTLDTARSDSTFLILCTPRNAAVANIMSLNALSASTTQCTVASNNDVATPSDTDFACVVSDDN